MANLLSQDSISGMMVLKNGMWMGYPWLEAIASVLPFVDEFLILEGYSDKDETWQICQRLPRLNSRIKIARYRWPDAKTGFSIGAATNKALSMVRGEWVWYVQGDELWQEDRAASMRGFLRHPSNRQFDSVLTDFLHLQHNCQEIQEGAGYDRAVRIIRRKEGGFSFRDAWTFMPAHRPAGVLASNPLVHANYWFWDCIIQKRDTQATEFYPDLGNYLSDAEAWLEFMEDHPVPPEKFRRNRSDFEDDLPQVAHPLLGLKKYAVLESTLDAIWRA